MYKILTICLLSLNVWAIEPSELYIHVGEQHPPENLVEKSKTEIITYKMEANDKINIENQFGDVKFKIWSKPEIKVEIKIKANAPDENRANSFVKIVNINHQKNNEQIDFKTSLACLESQYQNNLSKNQDKDDRNYLRVDYLVYLPEGHSLSIQNSHGDIYLPDYRGRLTIAQDYGNFFGGHLDHIDNYLSLNYGKAYIKSLSGGELTTQKSTVVIDKIREVAVKNFMGSIQIHSLENSSMESQYTEGHIQEVGASCEINVKYSQKFKISDITAEELKLQCNRTNLILPTCSEGKYQLISKLNNTKIEQDISRISMEETSNTKVQLIAIQGKVKFE